MVNFTSSDDDCSRKQASSVIPFSTAAFGGSLHNNKKNNKAGRYSKGIVNFVCGLALLCVLSVLNGGDLGVEVALPTARAFELNQKYKFHPLVLQGGNAAGQPHLSPVIVSQNLGDNVNSSNPLGYSFQDYSFFIQARADWGSFLAGAKADYFAPNATVCFNNSMNLLQYDVDLLAIKLIYGTFKENMLNTTLFLKNVSDLNYVCLDAAENLWVYNMYKFDQFGRDFTQLMLGSLQNVLANILKINKLVNRAVAYNEKNQTAEQYRVFGEIYYIMVDFGPIVLDDAGFGQNIDQDGEIFLQPDDPKRSLPKGALDQDVTGLTATPLATNDSHGNKSRKGPVVKADYSIDAVSFDFTFGLSSAFPGLKYLTQLRGPPNLIRGYINGSRMLQDESMLRCDNLITKSLIAESELLWNVTSTLFQEANFYNQVYLFLDWALLYTKILSQLHPITFNCWNGGETVYNHYYDVFVIQNGYNIKPYLLNFVYNFGHIYDAYRDFWLFMSMDPRGQLTNIYDAGYSLGYASYLFITPGIAIYESDAERESEIQKQIRSAGQ